MIPNFMAFVLMAILLMWVERSIGRLGGKHHHGSLPGMFNVFGKNPAAKDRVVIGFFVSTVIMICYINIKSWTLGFSFFSLFKFYFGENSISAMHSFWARFLGAVTGAIPAIIMNHSKPEYIPTFGVQERLYQKFSNFLFL